MMYNNVKWNKVTAKELIMKKQEKEQDTKIYFMPIGMVVGVCLGVYIGYKIKNMAISLSISIIIGIVIGLIIDHFRK